MLAVGLSACTALSVQPLAGSPRVDSICIQRNPDVIRSDMLPTVEKGFQMHGISTTVFDGAAPDGCDFVATYTATQTWDMAMVLKDAEIWIHRNGQQVAYGNFHLRGGGGFSLTKWTGAEAKILPMIDDMLAEYEKQPE